MEKVRWKARHIVNRETECTFGRRTESEEMCIPNLRASKWDGSFRVVDTSSNSALVTRIGTNSKPIRVQFDKLRIVPPTLPDDRVDTKHERDKRGRSPQLMFG